MGLGKGSGPGGKRPGTGGRRVGGGRKTKGGLAFRDWCRSVIDDPVVRASIVLRAQNDPEFALKIGEHGYGRPPQSLKVGGDPENPFRIDYRAVFADGTAFRDALPATLTALPDASGGEHGEG